MEKLVLNIHVSQKRSPPTDTLQIISFSNNEKGFFSSTPCLLTSYPRKPQSPCLKENFKVKFEERSFLPILKTLNFITDSKKATKQKLRIIQEGTHPNLSPYNKKLVELPQNNTKKTLLLDLNETLVHCTPFINKNTKNAKDNFSFKVRPYVKELLKFASKRFEIIVFTSGNKSSADYVLDTLDPSNKIFSKRLYGDSCIKTPIGLIKDLRILKNTDMKNLILVDNSLISFAYQLQNGVPILSWYGDPNDIEMVKLVEFLKVLDQVADVRWAIKTTFCISCG